MRNSYIVAEQSNLVALMDLTSSLLIVEPSEEDKQRAHDAIETVRELLINGASPFLAYREEILGHYSTATRLQDLVLHLWNDGNPVRLASLFGNADNRHTQIALELIVSYTRHGENDQHFMNLADEIRDMRKAAARRCPAVELAETHH